MKILVTGAKGNLGASIIAQGKGLHDFILINRDDWVNLDSKVLQSIDAVVHCAYDLKHELSVDPDKIMESNVLTTGKILKLVKQHKIPKFIFISTCAVYGSKSNTTEESVVFPESINGIVKLLNERMIIDFCKDTDIDVKILRIFNMYGGDDQFSILNYLLKAAQTGNKFTLNNDGISRRDFVHVRDVSNIILKILINKIPYSIMNIGTGKSTSIAELVDYVASRKKLNIQKSNQLEIEYSRANITRMKSCLNYDFIDIFDYLEEELTKLNKGEFI